MSRDDVSLITRAIEVALSSDDTTAEDLARAAMAVDPRVLRLKEALRAVCNQTDGTWAIMLARDALSEIENDFVSVAIPERTQ